MIQFHRRFLDEREKQRRWIDPRLYSVRIADIHGYLNSKGWKQVESDRPGFLVYQEPTFSESGPFYQFVPEREDWDGYPAQVYDLIAALALIEDRHAVEVLDDMLRLASRNATNGSSEAPATKTQQR